MHLHFKPQFAGLDTKEIFNYETVTDNKIIFYDKVCYELRRFGFIPIEFFEPPEEKELTPVTITKEEILRLLNQIKQQP